MIDILKLHYRQVGSVVMAFPSIHEAEFYGKNNISKYLSYSDARDWAKAEGLSIPVYRLPFTAGSGYLKIADLNYFRSKLVESKNFSQVCKKDDILHRIDGTYFVIVKILKGNAALCKEVVISPYKFMARLFSQKPKIHEYGRTCRARLEDSVSITIEGIACQIVWGGK